MAKGKSWDLLAAKSSSRKLVVCLLVGPSGDLCEKGIFRVLLVTNTHLTIIITYQTTNLCDSSDSSDRNDISDISDRSDWNDRSDSWDITVFKTKNIF